MTDARQEILGRFFDDAGLFPPTSLPIADACASHRRALQGSYAWMMGRFVVPAARLHELDGGADPSWTFAVLVTADSEPLPEEIRDRVEQVEIRADGDVDGAVEHARRVAGSTTVFVEVPCGDVDAIDEISRHRHAGVKVRCGGAERQAFPIVDDLATTVAACRDYGLRLKATAGLHRPFRHTDSTDGFVHHGFLNLAAAVVLAHAREYDERTVCEVLKDKDPKSFSLTADALSWRSEKVFPDECEAARVAALAGVGSCSFDEPVADLEKLGVLPL